MTLRANAWSQRVALAAGFRYEGVCRGAAVTRDGQRADLLLWARLATDPEAPGPRPFPDLPGGQLRDGVVCLRPARSGRRRRAHRDIGRSRVAAVVDPGHAFHLGAAAHRDRGGRERVVDRPAGRADDLRRGERATGGWHVALLGGPGDGGGQPRLLGPPAVAAAGFATRAAFLTSEWLLGVASVARVEAGAAVANTASQEVLRQAGFTHEGTLRSLVTSAEGPRQDIGAVLPGALVSAASASRGELFEDQRVERDQRVPYSPAQQTPRVEDRLLASRLPSPSGSIRHSSHASPGSRISARRRMRRSGSTASTRQKSSRVADAEHVGVATAAAQPDATDRLVGPAAEAPQEWA